MLAINKGLSMKRCLVLLLTCLAQFGQIIHPGYWNQG
jgi:hypothetical protein